MTVIEAIAVALNARNNCEASGNTEWRDRWQCRLDAIARNVLPSGSGFDNGTAIDGDSQNDCIKLYTSFHHMNDGGMYDGWTEHTVTVRPSLILGFTVTVSGRNRRDIKAYIAEMFGDVLGARYEWPAEETAAS